MEKKELSEREKLFLEYLFSEEIAGNTNKAKLAAGYSEGTSTKWLVERLEDEIIEATKKFISSHAPKAAFKLIGVLDNPYEMGTKELLAASKDLLDRAGLAKAEKIEVKSAGGIFILPPKEVDEDE